MNMVQVYIKGQEDKELSSFLRYYPVRIKNIGMDAFFDRCLIREKVVTFRMVKLNMLLSIFLITK